MGDNLRPVQNILFLGFACIYLIIIILGILLIALKTSPNPWFGVRVPWTMCDKEIWTRAQIFSGKIMIIIGIFGVMFNYFLRHKHFFVVLGLLVVSITLIAVTGIGYSAKIYKQKYHSLKVK